MYSLGVTLFQLTFGRLPYTFSSATIQGLMQTHRESAIEFPEVWPADLPTRWQDILSKLLEKSPSDRYQSYDELLGRFQGAAIEKVLLDSVLPAEAVFRVYE